MQRGKYGEIILTQERYEQILNAVQTYIATHPGTDSTIIDTLPPHFRKFLADCGIDTEEVESVAYDLIYNTSEL